MKFLLIFVMFIWTVDTLVYLCGHNSMFWKYKTPNELEYQRKRLGLPPAKPDLNQQEQPK